MGAIATHIYDMPETRDNMSKTRDFSGMRFGTLKVQGEPFVRLGAELAQEGNFSVTSTKEDLKSISTSPEFWAAHQKLLSADGIKLCRCMLGEVCRLAAAPRPDICARLARPGSRVNSFRGSDVFRIHDLKYASASCPKELKDGAIDGEVGTRSGQYLWVGGKMPRTVASRRMVNVISVL